jgi:chloramphenicol-sensitive protein RarD
MSTNDEKHGVIFAVLAYLMWGIAPLYFSLIVEVPALEILASRIVWSFALLVIVILAIKQWGAVRAILKSKRTVLILLGSSTLLCFNWGMFVWAVNNGHVLDASLGYYINPLLNILLGAVFLGERLKRIQGFAVGLAFTGVLIQVTSFGSFPILSFCLATSFAFYGLIRKTVAVDSLPGLLIESCVMLPVALVYWIVFADSPTTNMLDNSMSLNMLLIGTALVTTMPLLCFIAGAKRIKYTTMGFLQYIGPSIMFFLALFVYKEDVGADRWVTFGFIWAALVIFSWDSFKSYRKPAAAAALR